MTVLRERAFGKLNLTLNVRGARGDGYHELESVMAQVGLCDELTLTLGTGEPWTVFCSDPALPQNEGNLCWKAARLYFDAAGIDPGGLRIEIEKRVPAQAGMAGGSSDAAAVLRALDRHYMKLNQTQMHRIALALGSDVPFCLFCGVALARGRGEQLTTLPALPQGALCVLVQPEFSISTPALFRELDRYGCTLHPRSDALIEALCEGSLPKLGAALGNSFSPLVEKKYPVVGTLKRRLCDLGALGAELTGTGSVVYGIFDAPAPARAAAETLQTEYSKVWLTDFH